MLCVRVVDRNEKEILGEDVDAVGPPLDLLEGSVDCERGTNLVGGQVARLVSQSAQKERAEEVAPFSDLFW